MADCRLQNERWPIVWRFGRPLFGLAVLFGATFAVAASSPQAPTGGGRTTVFDELLDVHVRDGMVYYRALKSERPRLQSYLASLAAANIESAPREEQMAFWINAYNAIVLATVVDHYPIVARTREYPPRSIRQIPGAFERIQHRVAGRMLTLDQIEQTVLAGFHDPRVFFALGRGAMGSGRLKSAAYVGGELERQLSEAADECPDRSQCAQIDRLNSRARISSIFSWREKEFAAVYAERAPAVFRERSPIERAAIAFLTPKLVPAERDFLAKNEFTTEFIPFDWSLNDLTGRGQ